MSARIDLDALVKDARFRSPDMHGMWVPKATVAALVRAARTLERIAENAESWHGPEPDMGHVRALAVITTWAGAALAPFAPGPGEETGG